MGLLRAAPGIMVPVTAASRACQASSEVGSQQSYPRGPGAGVGRVPAATGSCREQGPCAPSRSGLSPQGGAGAPGKVPSEE